MKNLFERLFAYHPEPQPAGSGQNPEGDALAQQSRLHSLQLELAQRDTTIQNLQVEVERLRLRQDRLLEETLRARLDSLFAALAGPVVQLRTQEYLAAQGKPLQAADVLAVARRLVRGLERSGLVLEETTGACVPFDPLRHAAMDSSAYIQAGQPVIVRVAGASYQGKILQKAIVEAGEACQDA